MDRCFAVVRPLLLLLSVLLVVAPGSARGQAPAAGAPVRVDVILWFDTEDYLLPASDDAARRVAELLSERGVRATFKVVGEKARVLEKRGRRDVIAALKKHDIGFHSNWHSVHPTPTEYLAETGWLDGVAEFARREGPGAADVRRVFGVETLSCYGQPGSSWASQAIGALPGIGVTAEGGVPCYVDSGNHIGLKGRPFWYAGALNVFNMRPNETRFDLHVPQALEVGKRDVSAIVERLRGEGGGLVSIFYHPCEWVHKEFWDGVNFSRGANPPREAWKAPRQRSAEETDGAFARFAQYVDHIKGLEGVRFITARELPGRYPDRVRSEGATRDDLTELALRLTRDDSAGVNFHEMDGKAYSAADQFDLLTGAVATVAEGGEVKFPLPASNVLGPDSPPPAANGAGRAVDGQAFVAALADVRDFVQKNRRVPARVFVGADAVSPADFLVAVAGVWRSYALNGYLPTHHPVRIGAGAEVLAARHVVADSPKVFGGWVIHKEDFRAPRVLEIARLQAWTMKPALLPSQAPPKLRAQTVPIRPPYEVWAGAKKVPLEFPGIPLVQLPAGRAVLRRPDGKETEHAVGPIWVSQYETRLSEYEVFYRGEDIPDRERPRLDWRAGRVRAPYSPPEGRGYEGQPIGGVTLAAAQKYCAWLGRMTGRKFRLPTEAEWEYACRAGGPPVRLDAEALGRVAWYSDNSDGQLQPVGGKAANAWGLYDMLGNVAEYVIRDPEYPKGLAAGGSYKDDAEEVHSGAREPYSPQWQKDDEEDPKNPDWLRPARHVGFRVVMEE